ncbi:MAG: hypothetical protein U1E42_08560 [Rhodospirillales bacterium]
MRQEDARRLAPVVGLVALLGLSACASHDRSSPPPPQPAAEAQPTEPALLAEEYVEGEALVQAVNRSTRTVTLRSDDQRVTTVQVPPDVDLNRVKSGDRVALGLYQSISVRVLPPGSVPLGTTLAAGSTAPGQPEGRAWGQQVVVVAEITGIDLTNHTVTVTNADGKVHTINVKNPDMQARMSNLKVGDLLELTYADVVAAKVMPRS